LNITTIDTHDITYDCDTDTTTGTTTGPHSTTKYSSLTLLLSLSFALPASLDAAVTAVAVAAACSERRLRVQGTNISSPSITKGPCFARALALAALPAAAFCSSSGSDVIEGGRSARAVSQLIIDEVATALPCTDGLEDGDEDGAGMPATPNGPDAAAALYDTLEEGAVHSSMTTGGGFALLREYDIDAFG
jgi:hypothetical protein